MGRGVTSRRVWTSFRRATPVIGLTWPHLAWAAWLCAEECASCKVVGCSLRSSCTFSDRISPMDLLVIENGRGRVLKNLQRHNLWTKGVVGLAV